MMRPRITHRLGDDFDRRNPFLLVTLGAISFQHQLEGILAKHGSLTSAAGGGSSDPPVLDAMLGLVGFARTGIHLLESALREAGRPTASSAGQRNRAPRRRAPRDFLV